MPDSTSYSLDLIKVDVSKCFLVYLTLAGDLEKTSVACDVPVQTLQFLALKENWSDRLNSSLVARKDDTGAEGNFERQINRTINYVQAHRLRILVDDILLHVTSSPEIRQQFITACSGKDGMTKNFSARALVELLKAAEIVQTLTYRALGDKIGESAERNGAEDEGTMRSVGLNIMKALNESAEAAGKSTVNLVAQSLKDSVAEKLKP